MMCPPSSRRRHPQIHAMFLERFEQVREQHVSDNELSERRRLLIGAYFLAEYSLESAALFNPSIVPHTTRPTCHRELCGSFSACVRPVKVTFLPSHFAPGSSIADNRIEVHEPCASADRTSSDTEFRLREGSVFEKAERTWSGQRFYTSGAESASRHIFDARASTKYRR